MHLLIFNFAWMGVNIFLAVLTVIFGFAAYRLKQRVLKVIFLMLWLIFIPNTIYILTDLFHIPEQWGKVANIQYVILIIQYIVLLSAGLLSFIVSVYFFEKIISESRISARKKLISFLIIVLNFMIGFGVVLGRIKGANSWDLFMDTEGVIKESLSILTSFELALLAIFFGILGNLVYFLFRNNVISLLRKISEKIV